VENYIKVYFYTKSKYLQIPLLGEVLAIMADLVPSA